MIGATAHCVIHVEVHHRHRYGGGGQPNVILEKMKFAVLYPFLCLCTVNVRLHGSSHILNCTTVHGLPLIKKPQPVYNKLA